MTLHSNYFPISAKFPMYVMYSKPGQIVLQNTAEDADRTVLSRDGVSLITLDPNSNTMYYIKKTDGLKSIFREKDGKYWVSMRNTTFLLQTK